MNIVVTLDDQDAIDAMNVEIARIANAGTQWTPEQYLSDFLTTQHVNMRGPQLQAIAQAAAADDPAVLAFQKRQDAKVAQAEPTQIMPTAKVAP